MVNICSALKKRTLTLSNWSEKFICHIFHHVFYEIMQQENLSQTPIASFFIQWPIQNFDHTLHTSQKSRIMNDYSTDPGKKSIKTESYIAAGDSSRLRLSLTFETSVLSIHDISDMIPSDRFGLIEL